MKRVRPETPRVVIGDNIPLNEKDSNSSNSNEVILRNFSNFMRQIVDSDNEKFLNGDINVIDYVLAKYLKMKIDELKNLKKLSIRINGSYGLLNQFGQRLTELVYLKLNNSFIQNFSDLGTSFTGLQILQINNCKLKDLNGIICLERLEIMEAKNNEISDLIDLEMCTSITQLDLENNLVENKENIFFLGSLDKLTYINLLGNPIKNYEEKLKELLPNLKEIDKSRNICEENDKIKNIGYENTKVINNIFNNKNKNIESNTKNEMTNSIKVSSSISTYNESKSISSKDDKLSTRDPLVSHEFPGRENENENTEREDINTIGKNTTIESEIITDKIQQFFGNKSKFNLNLNLNELHSKEVKDLKPVVIKKKENKEIKMLRESFYKDSQKASSNATSTNDLFNSHKSNNATGPTTGIKLFKNIQNKNLDKVVIKSKDPKSKNDKFLEELRARRLAGNK